MANYSIWALGASQISISGGASLGNPSQGEGTHLVGRTITLNSYRFEQLSISDRGSDANFDDNDTDQVLRGRQDFDGSSHANNTIIEAEYRIVLRDPRTGQIYEALGVNIRNSSTSYATVEGLAFVDRFPPQGVALQVVSAAEGPGSLGQPPIENVEIAAPPCFTPGTLIATEHGLRPVEALAPGDRVETLDSGLQRLVWVGQTAYSRDALAARPDARPIRIAAHAFGPGLPARDMRVSAQHRILVEGPLAELCFGEPQVLAAAGHLADGDRIRVDDSADTVVYIHLQCAAHEILISDGLPSESFNPGEQGLQGFGDVARRDLMAVLPGFVPDAGPCLPAARPIVRRHEALLWSRLRDVAQRGAFPLASARALC